jgi:hypothetical protein
MKMNIRNQCSDFKLIHLNFFRDYMGWNKEPDEEVDAGGMTRADLVPYWAAFKGAITYQLQRKCVKSDEKLEPTYIQFFITWKSEGYKVLCTRVGLIEHDEQIRWNAYKLEEYCQSYANQFGTYTGPIRDKWLIYNGTVLMTRLELNFTQRPWVLNITISEGVKDEYIRRPLWLDPKT